MALRALNPDNALMFGSDDDRFYMADYPQEVDNILLSDEPDPSKFTDVGWISEDGVDETYDDSGSKIKGHQGHAVVKAFIESSETGVELTILETMLPIVLKYWNAKAEKVKDKDGTKDIVKISRPRARKAIDMVGIADFIETSTGNKLRHIYPKLTLTEREGVKYKVGEIVAWKFKLEVTKDPITLSNIPSLLLP